MVATRLRTSFSYWSTIRPWLRAAASIRNGRPLIGLRPGWLPGGLPTLPRLRPQWIAPAYGTRAAPARTRPARCDPSARTEEANAPVRRGTMAASATTWAAFLLAEANSLTRLASPAVRSTRRNSSAPSMRTPTEGMYRLPAWTTTSTPGRVTAAAKFATCRARSLKRDRGSKRRRSAGQRRSSERSGSRSEPSRRSWICRPRNRRPRTSAGPAGRPATQRNVSRCPSGIAKKGRYCSLHDCYVVARVRAPAPTNSTLPIARSPTRAPIGP